MKSYVLYDKDSFEIKRSGFCPEDWFSLQKEPNCILLEALITDETHVVNGVPAKIF